MIDCFISFCGADAGDDNVSLLVEELRARTCEHVNYRVYFEEKYGSSLTEFMRKDLLESKAILFLLGPEYCRRIDEQQTHTGVYQEFDNYVVRHDREREFYPPEAFPIWWAGPSVETCRPNYWLMSNPAMSDLHNFRCHGATRGDPFIPETVKAQYKNTLDRIAQQLVDLDDTIGDEALETNRNVLAQFLKPPAPPSWIESASIPEVLQLKYEHGLYDAEEFKEHLFTKTRTFRRLTDRNVGLVSGRKGSGKTTLVQVRELEAQNSDFFPVIDVAVERWNLHYLIQNTKFRQTEGDFEYADIEARFFDFVWCAFVSLSTCLSLLYAAGSRRQSASALVRQQTIAGELDRLVAHAATLDRFQYSSLFELSVSAAQEYIQGVVNRADEGSEARFRLDVLANVRIEKFMESLYGTHMANLRNALAAANGKRLLFCFDRFDTELQQYRKDLEFFDPTEKARYEQREINWLGSLTLLVDKTLRPDRSASDAWVYQFFSVIKFIVVLPHDRLLELREAHRDSIAGERVEEIRWQALELLTMLRKRLQVLRSVTDDMISKQPGQSPRDRFEQCLRKSSLNLPREITLNVGQRGFKMELFLYVLRHTLFRPRDVLIYYAAILSYCIAMERKGRLIRTDVIKQAISATTQTIVQSEFIGELKDTWENVYEVIDAFKGGNQLMDARKLERVVGNVDFKVYAHTNAISVFSEKIKFLYELGFLGYRRTKGRGGSSYDRQFRFSFLEDANVPPFDAPKALRGLEFAIHPIFVEFLFLEVNSTEPVLFLTWEWLDRIDKHD